mmetsp:Transcript_149209/g.278213  ORF Transcript_149209/g.278213 Transcript_149209/m.278213 type:complete len:515 (+) Transcript_149209:87-1631(+)
MDAGPQRHVVVRNTFLEFSDDAPALELQEPLEPRRRRAQTDLTDMKLPLKVELSNNANFYQVTRHRLSSAFDGAAEAGPPSVVGSPGLGLTGGLSSAGAPSEPGLLLPTVMEEPNDMPGFSLTELLEKSGAGGGLLSRATAADGNGMPFFGGLSGSGVHSGSVASNVGPQAPPPPYANAPPPWWGNYAGIPGAGMGLPPYPAAPPSAQSPSAASVAHAQWVAALTGLATNSVAGVSGLPGTAQTPGPGAAHPAAAAAAVAVGPQPQRGRRQPAAPQTMPQASGGSAAQDNMGRNRLQLSEHLRDNGNRAAPAPRAPKAQALAAGAGGAPALPLEFPPSGDAKVTAEPTTVMLRNLPNGYARSQLLELLDKHAFFGKYDFVYLPMDFRNGVNLGYAFVNLLAHEDALALTSALQGFCGWHSDSSKVCEVSWAHPHQGLREHVERYRNSPVMHASMPDEYKPMVFRSGTRVPFPPPTKTIKAPKLRLTAREGRTQGQDAGTAAAQLGMPDFVAVCA